MPERYIHECGLLPTIPLTEKCSKHGCKVECHACDTDSRCPAHQPKISMKGMSVQSLRNAWMKGHDDGVRRCEEALNSYASGLHFAGELSAELVVIAAIEVMRKAIDIAV